MVVPDGSLPLGVVTEPGLGVVPSGGPGTVGPGTVVPGFTVVGAEVVTVVGAGVVTVLPVTVVGAGVELPGGAGLLTESIFTHSRPNLFSEHSTAGM